jgi:hypothetical protein
MRKYLVLFVCLATNLCFSQSSFDVSKILIFSGKDSVSAISEAKKLGYGNFRLETDCKKLECCGDKALFEPGEHFQITGTGGGLQIQFCFSKRNVCEGLKVSTEKSVNVSE